MILRSHSALSLYLVTLLAGVGMAPLRADEPGVPPSRVSARIVPYVESWNDIVARDRKSVGAGRAKAGDVAKRRLESASQPLPAGSVLQAFEPPPVPAERLLRPASVPPTVTEIIYGITREDQELDLGGSTIPPDTMGAIGPAHFVETLNNSFAIFDRLDGSLYAHVAIESFFASRFGGTDYPREDTTDPRVLFDRRSGRWLTCIVETGLGGDAILAVSETSDPTGFWCKYLVQFGENNALTDYDTLGTDDNGVYLAARLFPSGGEGESFVTIAALEKAPLLAGSGAEVTFFSGLDDMHSTPQPAHNLDPVPTNGVAWFVASWPYTRNDNQSANVVYRTLTWAGTLGHRRPTLNNGTTLSTPAFANPITAPAYGSRVTVNTGNKALLMAVIRNNRLWTCRNVGVNASGTEIGANRNGCEWLQLILNGRSATLGQRGRVFDRSVTDARFYYFPSIMVNGRGDAVMSYSGSRSSEYIGAWYSTRLAGDPVNTMRAPELLKDGEDSYTRTDSRGRNRWGDYSYTSLDPLDDMSIWTVQEYAVYSQNLFDVWGTWIAKISMPPPTLNSFTGRARQGQTNVILTLTGTGFYDPGTNATYGLEVPITTDLFPEYYVNWLGPTRISLRFDIPREATAGLHDVVVTVINPDGYSAEVTGTFDVVPVADLAVSVGELPGPSGTGQPLSYVATVANLGPWEAVNVRLTNTLPPGVCFVSATLAGTFRQVNNLVICELGSIATETSTEVAFTVLPTRGGPTTNKLTVGSITFDSDRSNNLASFRFVVATNSPAPMPTLVISDAIVREGGTGTVAAVFNVCLRPASGQTVRVLYATANGTAIGGSDFVPTNGTLVFAPGQTSKTIVVKVRGDTRAEQNETFTVVLVPPPNAFTLRLRATGRILNDDEPTGEGLGPANLSLTLSSASPGVVPLGSVVRYSIAVTNNGFYAATAVVVTDEWPAAATLGSAGPPPPTRVNNVLTFPVGQLPAGAGTNIEITVTNKIAGTNHNFASVTCENPDLNAADNERSNTTIVLPAVSVVATDATASEPGTDTGLFTVRRFGGAAGALLVHYTVEGTAASGEDFVPLSGLVVLSNGYATATVRARPLNDTNVEVAETVFVTLRADASYDIAPTNGSAVVTILDNDPPALSIDDVEIGEGGTGTTNAAVFTVSLSAASSRAITVRYATTNRSAIAGRDYLARSGLLKFAAGTSNQTIAIPILGDAVIETNEIFLVILSAPANATLRDSQGLGTILNDDAPPAPSPLAAHELKILSATRAGALMRLRFTTIVGRSYRVEWTDRLDHGAAWTTVTGAESVTGTGAPVEVNDANAAGQPQRFYRVRAF